MPTPVTVTIQVDATGAIRGSQQAQASISSAVNNIAGSTQKMSTQTRQASLFLERLGDAPKRGISALDALNSTIIQATGGFQALGPASAAASTGLRAVLFGASNLLGPVATIGIALAGLATVFALTGDAAEKTTKQVEASGEAIRKLAQESGVVGASAQKILAKSIVDTEAAMGLLRLQMEALGGTTGKKFSEELGIGAVKADALKTRIAAIADPKQKQDLEQLVNQYAVLSQTYDDLTGKTEKLKKAEEALKKTQEIRFSLLTQGIAAQQAQSTTIAENNSQILKNIQLQIQHNQLIIRQATTYAEANAAFSERITLLQKELDLQLQGILTDTERANKKLEFENAVIEAQIERDSITKQIDEAAKRNTRELEQHYQSLADTIARAFFQSHFNILESFRNLLAQMAQEWLASGLKDLFASIVGGGKGKDFNFLTNVALPVGIGLAFLKPPVSNGGGGASTPALALPSAGRGITNINISVQALDTATLTAAVQSKIIPMIENAAAGRRTRIALS